MEVRFGMIDMIFKTDDEFILKKIIPIGEFKSWFENSMWNDSIGKKIDYVLNTCINPNGGIVEIQNIFFKYHINHTKSNLHLFISLDKLYHKKVLCLIFRIEPFFIIIILRTFLYRHLH